MIKWLIWTIWIPMSSVLRKADKLNLSLSLSCIMLWVCSYWETSVCRKGFRNVLKKLLAQFISYLAFTLIGWVSWPLYIFVFLASFSAIWWPNIWPKMGCPELFEKTIGSIHFIPGIYPYRVSFLTPIHFCVPCLIFRPLMAKYLAENGVSGIFWKKLLVPFITYLAFAVKGIFGWGYFWMRWVVIRVGVYCSHLWAQLVLKVCCSNSL